MTLQIGWQHEGCKLAVGSHRRGVEDRVATKPRRLRPICAARRAVLRCLAMGNTAMRTVAFKLPAEMDQKLTRIAQRRGTSRSAVVREALEALGGLPARAAPSVTEVAADLVGALSGPSDLATSKRYLAGYGR
jgi:Arc/MetJ-type ribon-helix-helix transcriptional regulator